MSGLLLAFEQTCGEMFLASTWALEAYMSAGMTDTSMYAWDKLHVLAGGMFHYLCPSQFHHHPTSLEELTSFVCTATADVCTFYTPQASILYVPSLRNSNTFQNLYNWNVHASSGWRACYISVRRRLGNCNIHQELWTQLRCASRTTNKELGLQAERSCLWTTAQPSSSLTSLPI